MANQLKWIVKNVNSGQTSVVEADSAEMAREKAKLLPAGSSATYTVRILTDAEKDTHDRAKTIPTF